MVVLHDLVGDGDPSSLRGLIRKAMAEAGNERGALMVDARGKGAMRLLSLYIKLGGELTHFVIEWRKN